MKPQNFKYANLKLLPPEVADYSENVEEVEPLCVWTDGEQCVSSWRLSWRERLSALFFGTVWIAVLSGKTQPPISATATKEYLQEVR